jgi:heterotetrameric sarcosine oxidase gamma subunit
VEWGTLARLGPDELALLAEDHSAARRMASRFSAQPVESGLTVTDWSHGQASLWLLGRGAPQALARLVGLDFGEHAFPDLKVALCALGGVRGLILRLDAPDYRAYYLSVGRSYGSCFWDQTAEVVARLGGSILDGPPREGLAGTWPHLGARA